MMKMVYASLVFSATCGAAWAGESIELYRNDVIPVKFQQDIRFSKSERGDRFSAIVDGDRTLPRGTVFEGRIVSIRLGRDRRPGTMDLEFNRIVLPNGESFRVAATPVAWKERGLSRSKDGRWEAKKGVKREEFVIGGLAGGLLIGSLAKKPFEGAFIGTLAGILLAESGSSSDNDWVIRRGDRGGALIERDVRLDVDTDDWDRGRLRVFHEGRELRFERDLQPYEADGTVMVPLEATAGELDAYVDLSENRDFILINGNDNTVRLNRNGKDYRINGRRRELPRNPETRNGVLFVPFEIFDNLIIGTLRANGTKFE